VLSTGGADAAAALPEGGASPSFGGAASRATAGGCRGFGLGMTIAAGAAGVDVSGAGAAVAGALGTCRTGAVSSPKASLKRLLISSAPAALAVAKINSNANGMAFLIPTSSLETPDKAFT